jgi:hypothetical protein
MRGIARSIHGPAQDRQCFVYGHIARRHVGVRNEKSRGRKAGNSSANDVSALALNAFRRECVDAVVIPHVRIPLGSPIV